MKEQNFQTFISRFANEGCWLNFQEIFNESTGFNTIVFLKNLKFIIYQKNTSEIRDLELKSCEHERFNLTVQIKLSKTVATIYPLSHELHPVYRNISTRKL